MNTARFFVLFLFGISRSDSSSLYFKVECGPFNAIPGNNLSSSSNDVEQCDGLKTDIKELKDLLHGVKNEISDLKRECNQEKHMENRVFKSCFDVQKYNNTVIDGEYPLQIGYPTCNQTVQIYCAGMNTSQPREYLTLKAGPGNNFSKKTYVNSAVQNRKDSSETQFTKIRIVSNLTVERDDFRFATITWYHRNKGFFAYAAAADCHDYSCTETKKGVFKMDLTGTGMKFVTPIDWEYLGWRGCTGNIPNQYSVSATKQVVSGRCGGYCGGCKAKRLKLKPEGC